MPEDEAFMTALAMLQLLMVTSLAMLAYRAYKSTKRQGARAGTPTYRVEVRQLEHYEPRRGPVDVEVVVPELTSDEVRVLRLLLEHRGRMYQSEIARALNMPKSTVSRVVRRLRERGLVMVRKVGRYSYVELTDEDYVSDLIGRSREK